MSDAEFIHQPGIAAGVASLLLVHDLHRRGAGWDRFIECLDEWAEVREISPDEPAANDAAVVIIGDGAASSPGARDAIEQAGALVLINCLPPEAAAPPACPTLLLRGRQSGRVTHESGVRAFERLPYGRIVELESCGDDAVNDQPEQVARTIRWFLSTV